MKSHWGRFGVLIVNFEQTLHTYCFNVSIFDFEQINTGCNGLTLKNKSLGTVLDFSEILRRVTFSKIKLLIVIFSIRLMVFWKYLYLYWKTSRISFLLNAFYNQSCSYFYCKKLCHGGFLRDSQRFQNIFVWRLWKAEFCIQNAGCNLLHTFSLLSFDTPPIFSGESSIDCFSPLGRSILVSSTSNTRTEFGGMVPATPLSPYPIQGELSSFFYHLHKALSYLYQHLWLLDDVQ